MCYLKSDIKYSEFTNIKEILYMKIVTIVGARPQFIKAAVVCHKLREKHTEILVHTGQHYDYNMSEKFFDELEIPKPDYNLGISGGFHGEMTGNMLIEIEKVLLKEKPDTVLLYGDTNSTLAGALAASKLHIPVVHVEAGIRTHCKTNPEELNRICTDHLSDKLLVCTENGMLETKKENLGDKSILVGDPMYDAYLKYSGKLEKNDIILSSLDGDKIVVPDKYYYLTCHREENTGKDEDLYEILYAMNELDAQTIYPVHPRNKNRVMHFSEKYEFRNIIFSEPVGYLESICLVNNSLEIVTDSGGLQREAFFAKKKCITVLDFKVWPETLVGNRNELAKPNHKDILAKLQTEQIIDDNYQPFGDGNASERIVAAI